MGLVKSKAQKQTLQIDNFSKVVVPKDYKIIKVATYNINLRNTVNLSNKLAEIINFISSKNKSKGIDIICFQGINDYNSSRALVSSIKKYAQAQNKNYYFAPDFENVSASDRTYLSVNDALTGRSNKTNSKNSRRINKDRRSQIQNLIVSKYPIISYITAELDGKQDSHKSGINGIIGIRTLIGANISIFGNVISVYNTELAKDIITPRIIHDRIRKNELDVVFEAIEQNKQNLKGEEFRYYMPTDIHILVGSVNIEENISNNLNNEFTNLIQNWHLIDIFRYLNDTNPGFTNTSGQRLDYIFFIMTNDIYNKKSKYYKKLQSLKTPDGLFKFIFKRYKLYFLDCVIRDDIYISNATVNHPVECSAMIKRNKH